MDPVFQSHCSSGRVLELFEQNFFKPYEHSVKFLMITTGLMFLQCMELCEL